MILLTSVQSLVSCSRNDTTTSDVLKKINSISDTLDIDPAAGFEMMETELFDSSKMTEYENKRLELLRFKAEDKNYVMHKSDSAIKALNAYFCHKGTFHDKLESSYYMAATYRDMNNYPDALKWFNNCYKLSQSGRLSMRDSLTIAFMLSQYAGMNHRIELYEEAYKYMRESMLIQKALGIDNAWTMADMGRMSYRTGRKSESDICYKKALKAIVAEQSYIENSSLIGELLGHYINTKDSNSCETVLEIIRKIPKANMEYNNYAAIGIYHTDINNNPDSALSYLNYAYKNTDNPDTKYVTANKISKLLKSMKDTIRSKEYKQLYYEYKDSVTNTEMIDSARTLQQRNALNQTKKSEETDTTKAHPNTFISLFSVIIGLVALVTVFYLRKKRRWPWSHAKYSAKVANKSPMKRPEQTPDCKQDWTNHEILRQHTNMIREAMQGNLRTGKTCAEYDFTVLGETLFNCYPDFHETIMELKNEIDMKSIYILLLNKAGFNQTEIATLLGLSRSAISRKLKSLRDKYAQMDQPSHIQ